MAVTELGGYLAWGHSGFCNTFSYYLPALDLTVSGCILNHHVDKGANLAALLVEAVASESP